MPANAVNPLNSQNPFNLPHWSVISVVGHDCLLYEPDGAAEVPFASIFLHDRVANSASAMPSAVRQVVERHGLRTIVPWAPDAWWVDRIYGPFDASLTSERLVTDHVLAWVGERWGATPPQVALWGVGMGGQGALRIAYRQPERFPIVAAISPDIDFQRQFEAGDRGLRAQYRDAEQARQDTATLHIHPLNWPRNQWFGCHPEDYFIFEGVDRLRMKLWSLGVPHVCQTEFPADKQPGAHRAADRSREMRPSAAGQRSDEAHSYLERAAGEAFEFIWARLHAEQLRVV